MWPVAVGGAAEVVEVPEMAGLLVGEFGVLGYVDWHGAVCGNGCHFVRLYCSEWHVCDRSDERVRCYIIFWSVPNVEEWTAATLLSTLDLQLAARMAHGFSADRPSLGSTNTAG